MIQPVIARPIPAEPVSRKVLGQFVEAGFGRQVNGMWAEMIYNRAFRPIAPYTRWTWEWLGFEEKMYGPQAPFWHSGYEEYDWEEFGGVTRSLTHGIQTYKGKHSLHMTLSGGEGGLRQKGIHVKAGREYVFRVRAGLESRRVADNADGGGQSVRDTGSFFIRFRNEAGSIAFCREIDLPLEQELFSFSVVPAETGVWTLEIGFDFAGGVFVSSVSMMPADNVKGWRRDVVELLKELRVPLMRFPGGCFVSFYDWEASIGPRDMREPMDSHYWGGLEENDVGLDEICDLAEEVGFEPQICFNMMSSSPFKARQMVEYLNAPADVGMGRLRALNGHPSPRHVKYFEMDNETDRKWRAEGYARAAVEFAREMRLADPSIEFMMQGYRFDGDLLRAMLDIAGGDINYLIQRRGDPEYVREQLELLRQYNRDTGHHVKLVNTEWLAGLGPLHPFTEPDAPAWNGGRLAQYGISNDYTKSFSYCQARWFYALQGAARCLDNMSHGGEFASANFNNCCNTWGQSVIDASKDRAWLSCAGKMFRLLGDYFREDARCTDYDTGRNDVRMVSLQNDEGETAFFVNDSPQTVEIACPGAWHGETVFAPGQLSCITETEDPLKRESICAEGSIRLAPWSVAAVRT